ncbi:MAG: hypothetical protein VKJ64_13365, partial [Leptolyngbyaceae bacterium]|nr:hypothetical protein [Leptolyngbyaceae bacterium]
MGYSSLEDFLVGFWEGFFLKKDANNLLAMLWTWQNSNIGNTPGFDGNFEKALAAIKRVVQKFGVGNRGGGPPPPFFDRYKTKGLVV